MRHDRIQKEMELSKRQEMFNTLLANSCIPKRFIGSRLDNFIAINADQNKVLGDAVLLASNQDFTGAIFLGNVGTGKTHLAVSIGIEFIKKGKSCLYTKLFNMILHIKESWGNKNGVSEREIINHYSSKDLLIIDEVGVQYETETERLYVTNIIDNRYNNLLPTILVGNITPKELGVLLGDRTMRRIREKCKVLVFSWKQNPNNG